MRYINKEDTGYIENKGDILACKYYHGFMYPEGTEAVGDCGTEKVNNKDWDVFHVNYETKEAYYGVPMLGIGLMDCMILKTDTRTFLDDELNYNLSMSGSFTGKIINKYNVQIEPIINKL